MSVVKRLGLMVCVVVLAGVFASPVLAAFPGRDGLLAVQPLQGSGIVLVGSNGRLERRVCPKPGPGSGFPCVLAGLSSARLEWSPDGRSLMVSGEPGVNGQSSFYVFYPDGTCLECQQLFHGAGVAAFTTNPTLFTAVLPVPVTVTGRLSGVKNQLVEFGVDGLARKVLMSGSQAISDPVWSSRGELAIVRSGWIWVGRPGELHRLTLGTSPSWSPRGTRLAFDRGGWVRIVPVGGGSSRRLVRGTSPSWSPNGRSIAFFGTGHQLEVIGAGGGRERRIGRVTGRSVDWQPLPAGSPARCQPLPDSTVIADGSTANVTLDTGLAPPAYGSGLESTSAYMGCLKTNGRRRLLYAELPGDGGVILGQEAAVTGNYAALAINYLDGKYDQQGGYVDLFDLRTGCELDADVVCDKSVPDRGDERVSCAYGESPPCMGTIDQLLLGNDAITAVHITQVDNGCTCTVEQIQASDRAGVRTLDSVTETDGSPPALTNLTLTGNTLTWEHNGVPESAELAP